MTRLDWGRVAPLLERMLELPEVQRRGWLAAECGGDAELFSGTWSAYEDALREDGFLASPLTAGRQEPGDAEAEEGQGERRVGPYRLVRVLGSGGMGTVWLAERVDGAFTKRVALKLVKRGMDTEAVVRRFRIERQVLADLEHPRIARLLDGGSTEEGLPYLVMELVEGRPLLRYCDEEHLGVEERLRLFQRICEAVHFAHERAVVHRDLKPSNVLVGADGEPKLLDFGIAKVLEAGEDAPTLELTRTGERFLSPRYASPEQIRGEAVGPASDVYALGVILYELLTSLHPHGWMTTSWREFELEVLERDPRRPSRALLALAGNAAPPEGRRARSARLRGDLDTIVLTALQKEPGRRYASAHALAFDIGRHLAGYPIHARPDTLAYRTSKYVRRNRGLVAGAGAFVLLLSVALAISLELYAGSLRVARAAEWEAYVGHVAAAESALANARVAEARAHLDQAPAALRGFEWRHLYSRLDRALRTLDVPYHGAVGVDAERGRLALSRERTLEVRDTASLSVLLSLEPVGPGPIEAWKGCVDLAFSPDGARLASVWDGGDLCVHDLEAEGRIAFRGERGVAHTSAAFHPRADRLIVGLKDGRIRELDPRSGAARAESAAHAQEITALAFDREGRLLASGSWDETVRLWDVQGLAPLHVLRGHTMAVNSVCFAPDGSSLLSSSLDGTLRLWDVATGASSQVHHVEPGLEGAALFDPSGKSVLVTLRGGIALLDARTRQRRALLLGHEQVITHLALDAGGRRLWSRSDGCVKEWDLDTQDVRTLPACEYSDVVSFDPRGGRFANAGPDRRIRLWAWPEGESLGVLECESGKVVGLRFHPEEERLYVLDEHGALSVLDPAEGRWLRRGEPAARVGDSALLELTGDPSGARLLCFLGEAIEIRDSDGALLSRIDPPREELLQGAVLDPEARLVAAGTATGRTLIWDAGTGALRSSLEPPSPDCGPARALAFHSGRPLLASGHFDGTIVLRDPDTGQERAVLTECRVRIESLAFHPDGKRLASGSLDGTIRLWDVETGRLVATLGGHAARVPSLEFSPDGTGLVSCSSDATVRLWETATPPER